MGHYGTWLRVHGCRRPARSAVSKQVRGGAALPASCPLPPPHHKSRLPKAASLSEVQFAFHEREAFPWPALPFERAVLATINAKIAAQWWLGSSHSPAKLAAA